MRKIVATLITSLCALPLFSAEPALPPYFPIPPGAQVSNISFQNYSEAQFIVPNSDNPVVQRGKLWTADMVLPGLSENIEQPQIWARVKPTFVKGGWVPVFEGNQSPFSGVLRNTPKNAWAEVDIRSADEIHLTIIEVHAPATSFALKPPAAKPENVSADSGDFPYLVPPSGWKLSSSSRQDGPMTVQLPGQEEPEVVASGSIVKSYTSPAGMSNLEFDTSFVNALKQAGWTIVENSQSIDQTDVAITAHYGRNDRNLWTLIHYAGEELSIQVADAGAEQLAAELAKKCHVPVYGILFDFNKATLRPDSDPELKKVQSLFTTDPALKLIVEGHTDNVGGAAPNQKLSEQRAASVVTWLVNHGVPAGRITSRGFGLTHPIASNDDAAGRARNRRVELRKEGCNP